MNEKTIKTAAQDWGLRGVEDDLETTFKATQNTNFSDTTASLSLNATTSRGQPETVGDFLRSFLYQMGMTETLDCFQAEWHEMVQKGLIDAKRVDVVPDVYTQTRNLETELKNAKKEADEYRLGASAAAETLVRVQKARDFHWLRHKRIIQEKNKLIEDIRKLTTQCSDYQPKVKQMNDKSQTLVKQSQTMAATLERDNKGQQQQHNKTPPHVDVDADEAKPGV